jgi:hypothetical protein
MRIAPGFPDATRSLSFSGSRTPNKTKKEAVPKQSGIGTAFISPWSYLSYAQV